MKHNIYFYCLPLLILVSTGLEAQQKPVIFNDVIKKSGIDFRYTFGDRHYENILESSGSGITVFDYNNDHLMDVFMMNGTYLEGISDDAGKIFKNTGDKLYKNNGNGTFTDVTHQSGLIDFNWSMAASAIDYDHSVFQAL